MWCCGLLINLNTHTTWDFPGGPVLKTLSSNKGSVSLILGHGVKISHALWPKIQKNPKKQKLRVRRRRSNTATNSIKNVKMVHIKKSLKIGILQQCVHWRLTLVFLVHLLFRWLLCLYILFSVSFFTSYWPWLLGFAIFLFLLGLCHMCSIIS